MIDALDSDLRWTQFATAKNLWFFDTGLVRPIGRDWLKEVCLLSHRFCLFSLLFLRVFSPSLRGLTVGKNEKMVGLWCERKGE